MKTILIIFLKKFQKDYSLRKNIYFFLRVLHFSDLLLIKAYDLLKNPQEELSVSRYNFS